MESTGEPVDFRDADVLEAKGFRAAVSNRNGQELIGMIKDHPGVKWTDVVAGMSEIDQRWAKQTMGDWA